MNSSRTRTMKQLTTPDGHGLPLKAFTVEIMTNPPIFMIELGLAKNERKTVKIQGYSLKDAKKRAGIL